MTHAIETAGVEKTFTKQRSIRELITRPLSRPERVEALRGVDLAIAEGEVFGLLGPNGAGKTTLLKILSCLILPDRGTVRVAGFEIEQARQVKPRIGLVHSDERSFYWRLSGRENMRFFATLYDVPRARRDRRIEELLERVDLVDAADRRFSDYSSGMKQRMAIARALLHDPPILLMDEPTRSLDPASSLALREFIRSELSLKDRKTIVLATHNLPEAEALCHRLAILMRGRVREVGTVEEIRRWGLSDHRYRLVVSHWPEGLEGEFEILSREHGDDGHEVELMLRESVDLGTALAPLLAAGVTLGACTRIDSDLEEAFSRLLDADRREAGA